MDLRVEAVTGRSKDFSKIKSIYTSSFLKEDRMPLWMMIIMGKMKSTEFLSFYDDQTLCGFVYMATMKKLTFVMFFAVDEAIRSKGYGSRILDKIQALHPENKIVITIEPCDPDAQDLAQRIRRKQFYAKNGYVEAGYLVEMSNKKQEVIIKNGAFDPNEFSWFFLKYSNGTMKPKLSKIEVHGSVTTGD